MKKKLYLAAPLFTPEERAFNQKLAKILSGKFDVFLPQRDGALVAEKIDEGTPPISAKMEVFNNDVTAIQNSDIVFAIYDGRTIDEGVAFEVGLAFGLGKKCWAYKSDVRSLLPHGDNPMLEMPVTRWFRSISEVRSEFSNNDDVNPSHRQKQIPDLPG
ncbi:nucleoside 2-deoxyribosyltransferase [Kordiimonas sp.]|uniref:nucleoside 2-deoxyribosyltransferase n=1 Tax=Kordiimonas sp. TaxID=1970157 RepID=UPI003A8FCA99